MRDSVADDFSPEQIAFWLRGSSCRAGRCNWAMLESAAEGGSGSSGMGSGRGERMGLVHLKADMERAADQLPLYWQVTRLIFSRQHRYSVWLARWNMAGSPTSGAEHEHPELNAALDLAIWRMAVSLGWQEGIAA